MSDDIQFETFVKNKDGIMERVTYVCQNVITGDTDSSYLDINEIGKYLNNNKEKITEVADKIADEVKQTFPNFMKDVFNVPDENLSIIDTEREIVSDKSYFLTKKRYIMNVRDKEGEDTNEHKIMGLEIRKSDTPKVVQNFLTDLVNMIMDGNSYEDVNRLINEFYDYYTSLSVVDVGRPMSVKVFKHYEDLFNQTGELKGFPYHVRAALFYNKHCTNKDRKIRSGDKIRVTYIKHPETNYIAVPVDAQHYPDIVNEVKIDWNRQWETVHKKAQNYLRPINWDDAGIRESNLNDLFGV